MENMINIAELLKDCPKGMELDCTMWRNLYFGGMTNSDEFPICCYLKGDGAKFTYFFTKEGCYHTDTEAKCVIFPKGKASWEGFVPPVEFKDGDIVVTVSDNIAIISKHKDKKLFYAHGILFDNGFYNDENTIVSVRRHATEEEKQEFFEAIKKDGFKWNSETKTLKTLTKPKFKAGDLIKDIDSYKVKITEVNIDDECYGYESAIAKGIGSIGFNEQDNWELVPDKFDIATLKPFESKVLVRDDETCKWCPAIWGIYDKSLIAFKYKVEGGVGFNMCIPYEENKHLLGTADDCDEYYKTWEE